MFLFVTQFFCVLVNFFAMVIGPAQTSPWRVLEQSFGDLCLFFNLILVPARHAQAQRFEHVFD